MQRGDRCLARRLDPKNQKYHDGAQESAPPPPILLSIGPFLERKNACKTQAIILWDLRNGGGAMKR